MRVSYRFLVALALVFAPLTLWGQKDGHLKHMDRGDALYNSGKYVEAFREYGKARELASELTEMELSRIDFHMALSAQRGGMPDAGTRLVWFTEQYPTSVYAPRAQYALGNMYFDGGDYVRAISSYQALNPAKLDKDDRSAYYFKLGYSYFSLGEYERVYPYMERIEFKSIYYTHAKYVLGYSDYRTGRLESAKRHFSDIADTESYSSVVPFYLLEIEYSEGNYHYVTENGPRILAYASGERMLEVTRMISESYFHNRKWDEAILFMERYAGAGGQLNRIDNYIMGFSYYMVSDYARAEQYLSKVPGQDDLLSQNASYHLGDVFLRAGDKHKAMQSFSIASVRGYDDKISEDALFNYGKLQYELGGGYFNEAINVLNRYITLYPDSKRMPQVKEYLVAAYYNSNNFEAAYQAIMQMPDPDNNIRAALQRITYFRALECFDVGDYSGAWALFEESLKNRYNAKYTALAGYWQGEILYRTGDYENAAKKYETYIRLSPKSEGENTIARYNLGYCYFNLRNWEKSKDWFNDFLLEYKKTDGFMADANNRLGDIEYTNRAFWTAIDYYDRAAKAGTVEKYYSAFQRAMTLGMVDRTDGKIDGLTRIVNTGEGPYVADAMYQLGRTYMVQQRFAKAAEVLEMFVEAYPESPKYIFALADLGLVYQNLNDNNKALTYYKKVVALETHSQVGRDAMNGIRSIYVDQNRVNEYFAYAREAGIESDLGAVQRDSLAFAAAQKVYLSGDNNKAKEALADYTDKYPRGSYLPNALYYRGEIARKEGQNSAALGYFRQVADMQSNPYTAAALEKVAGIGMEMKEFGVAADAYDKLSRSPSASVKPDDALAGYMSALIYGGDLKRIADTADDVIARATDKNLVRETKYTKAVAVERLGDGKAALGIFRELSKDVSNAEGAESAYRVIQAEYDAGNVDTAEKLVYEFADKNTPYAKWLGKAFLTLGDIYTAKGDTFQARATFQSLVDGYPNKEDGIVDEAAERIKNLK